MAKLLIADFSCYQSDYHGDPLNYDQLYKESYWTVGIDFARAAAAVSGVLIRVGIGTRKDPCFGRYLAGLKSTGCPWGIYHAFWPDTPWQAQAELVKQWCPETPPLGVYEDLEAGAAAFAQVDPLLRATDANYNRLTGVYSGGPYLNTHFTLDQQMGWRTRKLWIAGYPNFIAPFGWDAGAGHTLHQYTDKYQLPGLTKLCDMSTVNPATAWPDGETMTNQQPRGPMHGMHGEQTNSIIPVSRHYHDQGLPLGPLLSIENPGRCVDAKQIDPNRVTICRFMHPNPEWENGNNADVWSPATVQNYVHSAIQMIFDRTNDDEYQHIDFFVPGLNEWRPDGRKTDHPELVDWTPLGNIWKALCQEATNRSAEMTRLGLRPIRLALPGLAQGTPEYWQMKQVLATGLGDMMKARGDVWLVHEGPFRDQPWTTGLGDLIPGAPGVPPLGGSGTGRVFYWYQLGLDIDFIAGECYDGLDRNHPPEERYPIMAAVDGRYRQSPRYRGVCWFELTDNYGPPWGHTDFTPAFLSALMQDDVRKRKDEINGELDMQPLYHAKALIDLTIRDGGGNPATDPAGAPPTAPGLAGVVKTGTLLHIYSMGVAAGVYQNRAVINPNGANVWAAATALQKV